MVLVGFTADGDPVLNDPYAPDDDAVRRTVPGGGSRRSGSVAAAGWRTYCDPSRCRCPLHPPRRTGDQSASSQSWYEPAAVAPHTR